MNDYPGLIQLADLPLEKQCFELISKFRPFRCLAALAYVILQKLIIADLGRDSKLARSIGGDFKGWLSFTCYVLAIPAAFWNPWVATAIFGMVAVIWFIPDRRIERVVEK